MVRPYTYVVVFTDGLLKAGERYGQDLEIVNFLAGWRAADGGSAQELTEGLLARALELDRGSPSDDMSVVVLAALPAGTAGRVRRMLVHVPIETSSWDARHEEPWDEDLG
jgi:stage II sporulation SpoE-like protein